MKHKCDGCGEMHNSITIIRNSKAQGLGLFCGRCAIWWHGRNWPNTSAGDGKFSRPAPEFVITEIGRDYYGHDERAINKHSTRYYRTPEGNLYHLDRVTDAVPRYFKAYGPHIQGYQGFSHDLPIDKRTETRFDTGISWAEAERLFFKAVKAVEDAEILALAQL